MKFSVHGFNQLQADELNLTNDDLCVLRWFVDFAGTKRMKTQLVDGKVFYWVNYKAVLEDLPILHISKQTLFRHRFGSLCKAGVLIRHQIKASGTYSYYCYGINYDSLIFKGDTSVKNDICEVSGVTPHKCQKLHTKYNPNTISKNYTHHSENSPSATDLIKACFSAFKKEYPKQANIKEAERVYTSILKGKTDVQITDTALAILNGLRRAKEVWESDGTTARFIPLPSNWLEGERWKDDYGQVGGEQSLAEKLGFGG